MGAENVDAENVDTHQIRDRKRDARTVCVLVGVQVLRLRCVTIEDLVALKRYAGGLSDHADIVQLLARNPDADLAAIRATAAPFDAGGQLETLIEQAAKTQLRHR